MHEFDACTASRRALAAVNSKLDGLSIDTKETDAMLACFAAERRIVEDGGLLPQPRSGSVANTASDRKKDSIDDEGVPIPQAQLKPALTVLS